MKSVLSYLFIISNVVFVSILFWLLITAGQIFYISEDNLDKKENFECGFSNTSIGDNQLNFKNTIVFSFLLVYDIELLLLLPTAFNVFYIKFFIYQALLILFFIIYTCILDIEAKTLEYDN